MKAWRSASPTEKSKFWERTNNQPLKQDVRVQRRMVLSVYDGDFIWGKIHRCSKRRVILVHLREFINYRAWFVSSLTTWMTLSESVSVCALDSLTSADLTIHLCVVTAGECDIYINTDALPSKTTLHSRYTLSCIPVNRNQWSQCC